MKLIVVLVVGAVSTACFGCASGGPVRADLLARAQSAVQNAQEAGAEANAQAADHLRVARGELAAGRKLLIDGDQERAAPLLLRAEADAELAMNTSREAEAIAEAKMTRDEVRSLRTSMKGGD